MVVNVNGWGTAEVRCGLEEFRSVVWGCSA